MTAGKVCDDVGDVLILGGALWSLLAGIGLLRLPDVLTRMHAATKPQVLGLLMVLTGVALRLRDANDITTLILVGIFQTWTVPVAAHMIARAAREADAALASGPSGSGGSGGSGGPGAGPSSRDTDVADGSDGDRGDHGVGGDG
jgi:multicomponent Na+:H+ antiporter subunit G